MLRFILVRLSIAIPLILIVAFITFALVHAAPGGPFDQERQVPPAVLENLNQRYHLDKPFLVQFVDYVGHAIKGDLGPSFKYPNRKVTEIIASGFPVTFELALYAALFALGLGVTFGVVSGLKPRSMRDYSVNAASVLAICLPSFVLGPLLVLVFSLKLGWLPVSGWGQLPGDKLLPTITLGAGIAAYIARLTRSGMLNVASAPFVRTARSVGLRSHQVMLKHMLRHALLPVVAYSGPAIAGLLAGSFVVETVFSIPGLGRYYLQAALNRDYTMVLGTTLFYASLIIFLNLLSDVLQMLMNPSSRLQNIRVRA